MMCGHHQVPSLLSGRHSLCRKIEGGISFIDYLQFCCFIFNCNFQKFKYRDGHSLKQDAKSSKKKKAARNWDPGPCSPSNNSGELILTFLDQLLIPFLKVILRRPSWQRETSDSYETSRILVVAVACLKAFRRSSSGMAYRQSLDAVVSTREQ